MYVPQPYSKQGFREFIDVLIFAGAWQAETKFTTVCL
jgi:hypothetical protein